MGRGGPAEPEVVERPPTIEDLVALLAVGPPRGVRSSRARRAHRASSTIGCRRAGGGLAGAVFTSNVAEGARIAAALEPGRRRLRRQRRRDPAGRRRPRGPRRRARPRRRRVSQPLPAARLRPRRVGRLGRRRRDSGRLALAADRAARSGASRCSRRAAPTSRTSTQTSSTSRRTSRIAAGLREELAALDADTYLVELKAAAIDVVAEHALRTGARRARTNELVGDGLDDLPPRRSRRDQRATASRCRSATTTSRTRRG